MGKKNNQCSMFVTELKEGFLCNDVNSSCTVGMENMLPCEVRSSQTSSEVAVNFERSCCELRAKLLRTSREAVLQTSSEVVVNVERTSSEIVAKLERTSSEVTRLCVAKELHALRTSVYVALKVKRNQSISCRVQHGKIQ